MTHTTFGYDQEEDRLWLHYSDEHPRIWLTRRFAQGLIAPMAALVEQTTAGSAVTGLSTYEQVRMEHQLAVSETPSGEPHYPFRMSTENRNEHVAQGFTLCKMLGLRMEPSGCLLTMQTDEGEVNFGLSRYDMHLWLRAFRMALDAANWNLETTLPAWLTESVLPPAIKALLEEPMSAEMSAELTAELAAELAAEKAAKAAKAAAQPAPNPSAPPSQPQRPPSQPQDPKQS